MSRKSDLISVYQVYKELCSNIQRRIEEVNNNAAYTEVGREEENIRIIESISLAVQQGHDKGLDIIDKALDQLLQNWKKAGTGKLMDGGYQAGLANVIKMLELNAIQSKEDMQNIIAIYEGDFNAMSVIRKGIEQSENDEIKECLQIIPKDNREYNKRLIGQLRNNTDQFISIDYINSILKGGMGIFQGLDAIIMSIDGMTQFLTDRLGDDLELIN